MTKMGRICICVHWGNVSYNTPPVPAVQSEIGELDSGTRIARRLEPLRKNSWRSKCFRQNMDTPAPLLPQTGGSGAWIFTLPVPNHTAPDPHLAATARAKVSPRWLAKGHRCGSPSLAARPAASGSLSAGLQFHQGALKKELCGSAWVQTRWWGDVGSRAVGVEELVPPPILRFAWEEWAVKSSALLDG